MSSWIDTKAKLTERQNDIATYVAGQMNQDITALNQAIAAYIQKGGVGPGDSNPDYDTINTLSHTSEITSVSECIQIICVPEPAC
jgi:hypothetical protein